MREFFYPLLYKLKAPVRFVIPLGVLFAAAWYIVDPTHRSIIYVPGNVIVFDQQPFKTCTIQFARAVPVRAYRFRRSVAVPTGIGRPEQEYPRPVNATVGTLVIEPSAEVSKALQADATWRVTINMGPIPDIEVTDVTIDGAQVKLSEFASQVRTVRSELRRVRYIRHALADIVFRLNDAVSNVVLTILAFAIVPTAGRVLQLEAQTYVYSDEHYSEMLRKAYIGNDGVTNQDRFDMYAADSMRRSKRFAFLQALGPAIGFILTVSSLIQALHPATRSTADLDAFLAGIHVAMVSTFLGLLLRLVALEGARVNDVLLERADLALNSPEISD